MNVPISWILFRTSVPDIHHYFLSSLPRKLSADFRCRKLTHRIRWIVCLCLATSQGHKRGLSLFYFQLYWIPIRLFPLNKKLLGAKPRRPERRWTAGFCLTRRVTIREIQRLSYWKASLRDCHRMLITFVLARHFRTGCDLCWEECGVFPPPLLSVSRDYSRRPARGRSATLLVPSSQWAQRSVLKGIELGFVHYRSLLDNKVGTHQSLLLYDSRTISKV